MKKLFFILVAFTMCVTSNAQGTTDTTKKSKFEFNSEFTIASRNYARGVGFGESPSLQGLICVSRYGFELGTYGGVTATGNRTGYGNWVENYLTYKYKNLSLTIDDFFFYNSQDTFNNFFDYNSTSTNHFVEARVKYEYKKIQLMAGYVIYSCDFDTTTGAYVEATFDAGNGTTFFAGYITAPSMLNFMDAGGFTNIGVSHKRKLKISDETTAVIKTTLAFNPSYDSVTQLPGIGRNPVNLIFAITF